MPWISAFSVSYGNTHLADYDGHRCCDGEKVCEVEYRIGEFKRALAGLLNEQALGFGAGCNEIHHEAHGCDCHKGDAELDKALETLKTEEEKKNARRLFEERKEYIRSSMVENKVVAFIKENAEIKEVKPRKPRATKAKAEKAEEK